MSPRSKYGQGSLFQRKDGRWVGKVPDGAGGYRYATGTDRAVVRARMTELRRTISSSRDPALRDHVEAWFADVAPHRYRSTKTVRMNLEQARLHILPTLGNRKLSAILPSDVQRVIDRMSARGYAPQTVANVKHILSVVLRSAEADGIIPRNPASLVRLPKRERPTLPSLSTADAQRFVEVTRGERFWPVWSLAFATGIRLGELLGLRWSDWDRDRATLSIDGQWERRVEKGAVRYVRRPGKTANARRLLYLPSLATEALTAQLAQATSAVVMFATADGRPLSAGVANREFHRALERHGFPSVRFHSLRHSAAASMLDVSGGDVVAVSKTLGHATLAITVDTYGRDADDARKRGARYMDEALSNLKKTSENAAERG